MLYLILSIKAINLTRRQSNFIDSVTHELKSPIASMKLYLQTLHRRHVRFRILHAVHQQSVTFIERHPLRQVELARRIRIRHQQFAAPFFSAAGVRAAAFFGNHIRRRRDGRATLSHVGHGHGRNFFAPFRHILHRAARRQHAMHHIRRRGIAQ